MKKKLLSMILLGSLMLTGCSKLEKIVDILLEEETEAAETEITETEASGQTDIPEETEPAATPVVPEIPAEPEITEPDETPVQPEVPETPAVPETPVQPDTGEEIMSDNESFAGHWECLYTEADGNDVMLYLSMTEDGRASYSYGYGNSEMAEIFGGWWGIADAYLGLNFTGGTQDLELGYVPEPYDFESVYDYEWVKPGSSFKLRLNSGTALLFGSENAELTFECTGAVDSETFEPFAGVRPKEMDPNLVIGDWYSTYWHPDGYELAMHLTVNEDGTASYLYRYAEGAGEIYEMFDGTWIADAAGNFILDMHGGWANAEESEHYDFEGHFRWNLYGGHLSLIHEEGNPLIGGCENWFFEFLPFEYVLYDGEWVTFDDDRQYSLHLLPNGEAFYGIMEGDVTVSLYEGWWSVTEQAELELSMKLTEGEGGETLNSVYTLNWVEYPYQLDVQLGNGGFALTTNMAVSGSDIFSWIDPNALG